MAIWFIIIVGIVLYLIGYFILILYFSGIAIDIGSYKSPEVSPSTLSEFEQF